MCCSLLCILSETYGAAFSLPPLGALPPLVGLAIACVGPVADRLGLIDFNRLSLIGLTLPRASIGLEPARSFCPL